MSRILAIDYGVKRCGIAVTDTLQLTANGLDTIATDQLFEFLERYLGEEEVATLVIGEPLHKDGTPTSLEPQIEQAIKRMSKLFPDLSIARQDEQFTSVDAKEIILQSGVKKKKRRDKALVDKVSAVLILQRYLEEQRNHKGL